MSYNPSLPLPEEQHPSLPEHPKRERTPPSVFHPPGTVSTSSSRARQANRLSPSPPPPPPALQSLVLCSQARHEQARRGVPPPKQPDPSELAPGPHHPQGKPTCSPRECPPAVPILPPCRDNPPRRASKRGRGGGDGGARAVPVLLKPPQTRNKNAARPPSVPGTQNKTTKEEPCPARPIISHKRRETAAQMCRLRRKRGGGARVAPSRERVWEGA